METKKAKEAKAKKSTNPLNALAKLFARKSKSTLVEELYSRGIGRPLLANADMGAIILRGFLGNPVLSSEVESESTEPSQIIDGIGVLDISGALVSRPMGFCSPLSYAEITHQFDSLLANEAVNTIVLRIDSAGGEVSGLFDLSDHIYNARGQKPIIAVVDDMAYSAAYGIASAADKIVLSRTGGVGSVGVVSYHVDQSEANKKRGVKVEYIYAGERKIDGNPNQALSDVAKETAQLEINRLYQLFVTTIARNRNLSLDTVRDTEASTYHGELALSVGFADEINTFSEVIINLLNPVAEVDKTLPQVKEQPIPQTINNESLNNEPLNNEPLVKSLSAQQEAEIRAMCTAAGLADVADYYIKAATLPTQVRSDLFSVLTAGETEINTAEPVEMAKQTTKLDINQIYKSRKRG